MGRSAAILLALLGTTLSWIGSSTQAAPWPRFRGPNGTGVAADANIPVEWTDKEVLWKVPVPGVGHSSPVIWGERLFLQASSSNGKERLLCCFDVRKGELLWSKGIAAKSAHTHAKSSLASSTPATDGERVYVMFWDGERVHLHAYDFQGELAWKHDLGRYSSQHGAGASPIVHGGWVVLANDHDDGAQVLVFRARDGKPAWEAKRKHYKACYAAPLVLERDGQTELIVGSTTAITSYELSSGKVLWEFKRSFDTAEPLRTVGSPIYCQGLILATSGNGGGDRHVVAVKAEGKGDVTRTNLAWEDKLNFPYVPCLLARGEHVYCVHDKGTAGCYVAKTGEEVWKERLGGNFFASPILVDGKVYAISEDGTVYVFAADTKFKLLASNKLGQRVLASPAVADGRLYIRGITHLFCIGKP